MSSGHFMYCVFFLFFISFIGPFGNNIYGNSEKDPPLTTRVEIVNEDAALFPSSTFRTYNFTTFF